MDLNKPMKPITDEELLKVFLKQDQTFQRWPVTYQGSLNKDALALASSRLMQSSLKAQTLYISPELWDYFWKIHSVNLNDSEPKFLWGQIRVKKLNGLNFHTCYLSPYLRDEETYINLQSVIKIKHS